MVIMVSEIFFNPLGLVHFLLSLVWLWMLFISFTNVFFMPKVARGSGRFGTVLIPARDEAENLRRLLPQLMAEVEKVIVYDDGSSDGTGDVAHELGATVIRGDGVLPEGWTGKNHACWQLAKVAAEVSSSEWWLFLDADTQVEEGFGGALGSMVRNLGGKYPVITGLPRMLPGKFPEPVYLFWVPWVILSTIPFGLIYQLGVGHIKFTNGQFVLWNSARYFELNPHEMCKGEILEDVKIGRYLAKQKVRVVAVVVSRILSVRMYDDLAGAWQGMLKNSYWVAGNPVGSVVVALFFFGLAGTLLLNPIAFLAGLFTAIFAAMAVKTPWYTVLLFPLSVLAAGVTQLASMVAAIGGGVEWKGRKY
jgi:glycosyltransferase involved in cell wall biosynthesis